MGRSVKKPRVKPCPDTCGCLCHDTGGGVHDHPGQPCPGKAPAAERTLTMFSTRDRAPGVKYVEFEHGRVLLTTKPGNALVSAQVRGAIVRIAPEAHHTDDEVETLRNVLKEWGALRVFVLPKPKDKVLPERGEKTSTQARSLRQVVTGLVADSAFDNKAMLAEFTEEIMVSEGL